MSNHYFHALPPLTIISSTLLLALTVPVLLGINAEQQYQQTLLAQLADEKQQLLTHQQAAEAIRIRQRNYNSAIPANQQPSLAGLAKLAHAWKDDVALLSLDLDTRQHRIRIELASHSLEALLDFVSRLQQPPTKVGLENHARDPSLSPPWQIRSTLSLEYDHAS